MGERAIPAARSRPGSEDEAGLERIIFFSDAVMAIAITLLVLEIRLPAGTGGDDAAGLAGALLAISSKYVAYALSFFVIGLFWISHHLRFRYIRRYDAILLWLNLLFLMVIAFVPFASSVLAEFPNPTAFALYDGTMLVAALLSDAIWWYATWNDRLVDADLDETLKRRILSTPLKVAAVFATSIVLSFVDVHLARWVWLLLIFGVVGRRRDTESAAA